MEPVPEPWEAQRDTNDMILYYNGETGEQTHQHPCDEAYRSMFRQKRNAILKSRGQAVDESQITADNNAADKSLGDQSRQDEPIVSDGAMPPLKSGKPNKGPVTFYPS